MIAAADDLINHSHMLSNIIGVASDTHSQLKLSMLLCPWWCTATIIAAGAVRHAAHKLEAQLPFQS
jgi:hypothetical protein